MSMSTTSESYQSRTLSENFSRSDLERELLLEQELWRRQCRTSLTAFSTEALAPFEQEPAAHHRLLIKELEAIARGDIHRLMVCMPPGSAKSTYASVLFPAWLFAQAPNLSIIGASHTADLADAFSRRVMGIVRENTTTLGYGLATESMTGWSTTNGGFYKAAGVGGPITGRRADCVTGDTNILTNNGLVAIKDIDVTSETVYTLTYDEKNSRSGFRRILAVARRDADVIWRIRTASGRVVEATGNHRFWVNGDWTPASSIVVGDVLLSCVQGVLPQEERRGSESGSGWTRDVLPSGVRDQGRERFSGVPATGLQALCGSDAGNSSVSGDLFGRMPASTPPRWSEKADQAYAYEAVCCVPDRLYPQGTRRHWAVLQPAVQGQGARATNERDAESRVASRSVNLGIRSALSARFSEVEADHPSCGWLQMRDMRVGCGLTGSPHQYDPSGQQSGEFGDLVPVLPSTDTCWGAGDTQEDAVALVERVCCSTPVYDIQVEGTECFFANGILVHNCAIIDDPVKSREDADSERYRDRAWNWFSADLRTRLKPGGKIVVIMTRWHEDDLGGRLLQQQGDLWRVLKLPAIAGENDPMMRVPGEWLWGDDSYGYSAELQKVYSEYQSNGAMRDWSALFQQEPRPGEGALFKTGMIGVMDAAPAGNNIARAWDLAATEQTGTRDPDWTVGVKLLRMQDGRFVVLDIIRVRGGPDEVEQTIVNTAAQDGRGVRIGIAQDPGQAGKQQILYLTRKLTGYRVESSPETGDKSTRAAPVASQVNVGNVSVVKARWNAPFIDELAAFPSGTKDDQVDALSRAFSMVGLNRPPMSINPALLLRV